MLHGLTRLAPRALAVMALAASAGAARLSAAGDPMRPNIVFILADDLGLADTTLYGHTKFYRTPNLESLAGRGMKFTQAYSASPLCSPTRASIMTGLSPARIGITLPVCHLPKVVLEASPGRARFPDEKATSCESATRLDTKYRTLAESLKDTGYATGHFGKWHLGAEPYSPREQGFDVDVPHTPGPGPAGGYLAPWRYPDFKADAPGEHIEDRMAAEAIAFMEKNRDRPFFLNYWMFSVHAPFGGKPELVKKYRALADQADPQHSPTYAAMVESMDVAVGRVLDALDRLGLADNTIVIFTSDNGGNMYSAVDGTVPTSNAPLRGGKGALLEGGIHVPALMAWPGVIPRGSTSDALIQSSDYYPTLLELLSLPREADQRFDGVSFLPALKGRPLERDAIFTFFPRQVYQVPDWVPPAVAARQGDWKLIRIFHGGEDGAHRWQLFNVAADAGERRDLAAQEPQRVKAMDALIERFLTDTGAVVPRRNPGFDPAAYGPDSGGGAKPKQGRAAAAVPVAAATPPPAWKIRGGEAAVASQPFSMGAAEGAPDLRQALEARGDEGF